MLTLAIETSCDETGVALLHSKELFRHELILNLLSSQVNIHQAYGGVVPQLAMREHEKNLPLLTKRALKEVRKRGLTVTDIAYTHTPGLEPALLIGRTFAASLGWALNIPTFPINHLYGHLFSSLLTNKNIVNAKKGLFPAIGLLVSGGHTQLYLITSFTQNNLLGETHDDAAGEAFDKVARLLGYPYPGGPPIEALAKEGRKGALAFPSPMITSKDYSFSFSGLKTAVLYFLQKKKKPLSDRLIADVALAFQEAALSVIVEKTKRALEAYRARSLLLGGGVAANKILQAKLRQMVKKIFPLPALFIPEKKFAGDNAAMIALAHAFSTYSKLSKGKKGHN